MGSRVDFIQLAPEKLMVHGGRLSMLRSMQQEGQLQSQKGLRTSFTQAAGRKRSEREPNAGDGAEMYTSPAVLCSGGSFPVPMSKDSMTMYSMCTRGHGDFQCLWHLPRDREGVKKNSSTHQKKFLFLSGLFIALSSSALGPLQSLASIIPSDTMD